MTPPNPRVASSVASSVAATVAVAAVGPDHPLVKAVRFLLFDHAAIICGSRGEVYMMVLKMKARRMVLVVRHCIDSVNCHTMLLVFVSHV